MGVRRMLESALRGPFFEQDIVIGYGTLGFTVWSRCSPETRARTAVTLEAAIRLFLDESERVRREQEAPHA